MYRARRQPLWMQSHLDCLKTSIHLSLSFSDEASRNYHLHNQNTDLYFDVDRRAHAGAIGKPPRVSDVRATYQIMQGLFAAPLTVFASPLDSDVLSCGNSGI